MPINMFTGMKGKGLQPMPCEAPEGYVQPGEPEAHDGHDYEGFRGGCIRLGCGRPRFEPDLREGEEAVHMVNGDVVIVQGVR